MCFISKSFLKRLLFILHIRWRQHQSVIVLYGVAWVRVDGHGVVSFPKAIYDKLERQLLQNHTLQQGWHASDLVPSGHLGRDTNTGCKENELLLVCRYWGWFPGATGVEEPVSYEWPLGLLCIDHLQSPGHLLSTEDTNMRTYSSLEEIKMMKINYSSQHLLSSYLSSRY